MRGTLGTTSSLVKDPWTAQGASPRLSVEVEELLDTKSLQRGGVTPLPTLTTARRTSGIPSVETGSETVGGSSSDMEERAKQ